MQTDTLNSLVSGAIWRAEQLEARGIGSTAQAWAEVSSLEEELAKVIAVSESEGRIARRGAVRAALKAGDYVRAYALTEGYASEQPAPRSLQGGTQQDPGRGRPNHRARFSIRGKASQPA